MRSRPAEDLRGVWTTAIGADSFDLPPGRRLGNRARPVELAGPPSPDAEANGTMGDTMDETVDDTVDDTMNHARNDSMEDGSP